MKKIGIKEVRHAIEYVVHSGNIQNMTDEELLNCDLTRDIKMGNIRVYNVVIDLQRTYCFSFPIEMFQTMSDNTVRSLLNAINEHQKLY